MSPAGTPAGSSIAKFTRAPLSARSTSWNALAVTTVPVNSLLVLSAGCATAAPANPANAKAASATRRLVTSPRRDPGLERTARFPPRVEPSMKRVDVLVAASHQHLGDLGRRGLVRTRAVRDNRTVRCDQRKRLFLPFRREPHRPRQLLVRAPPFFLAPCVDERDVLAPI